MQMWTLFHVIAVFIAFALSAGVGIFQSLIAGSSDVRAIRVSSKAAAPLHAVGGVLLIVGAVLGVIAANRLGYSLTAPWLVAAYVLVLLIILLGVAVSMPWARRIEKAAAASPDDIPSADLIAAVNERGGRIAGPLTGLLWITALVVMILKP